MTKITRRSILGALLATLGAPLVSAAHAPTPGLSRPQLEACPDHGEVLLNQWYGNVPSGYLMIPVAHAGTLPWVPDEMHLVHQLNSNGSVVPLYLIR